MQRRQFLMQLTSTLVLSLLLPLKAVAAIWNKAAFDAMNIKDAKKNLAIDRETPSQDIIIIAPDKAENGSIVQVKIQSKIPNTEAIAIFVEKNPTTLIGNYMLSHGAQADIITRIKMAESDHVKVVVKAGNQYYTHQKFVEVLSNGCG